MIAGIWLHTVVSGNRHLIAIQKLLDEQLDGCFKVSMDYEDNEIVESVTLLGDEKLYLEGNICFRVDKAQKLIYSYIMEHKEAFDFIYKTDKKGVPEEKPAFELCFVNTNESEDDWGRKVFRFFRMEEWKDTETEGFDYLRVYGEVIDSRGESKKYTLSQLLAFTDIKKLSCTALVIDNADVAGNMPHLTEIELCDDISGDDEFFWDRMEMQGIEILDKDRVY